MKRLNVFLVALLVVCSCVWALPGAKKTTQAKVETVTEKQPSTATTSEQSGTTSQTESELTAQLSESLLQTLKESNFIIGTEKIEDITSKAETLIKTAEAQTALVALQQEQIDILEAQAKKTKFFADFGVAIGFKESGVTYGATMDMGLKIKKGLMLKVGTTYMIGSLSDFSSISWSLDNMIATCTIGWEW